MKKKSHALRIDFVRIAIFAVAAAASIQLAAVAYGPGMRADLADFSGMLDTAGAR